MLGKPDEAPLVRRLPGTENPNLLAIGAEVTEATVPVGGSGTSASGEALARKSAKRLRQKAEQTAEQRTATWLKKNEKTYS
eukprot:7218386-Lingulodinium_polyedra.AAC.1